MRITVFKFYDGMYLGQAGRRIFSQPVPIKKTDDLFRARQFESDDDVDYLNDLNGRLVTLKITATEVEPSSDKFKRKVTKKMIDELMTEKVELRDRRKQIKKIFKKHLNEFSAQQQAEMSRQLEERKKYIQALDERLSDLNDEVKDEK